MNIVSIFGQTDYTITTTSYSDYSSGDWATFFMFLWIIAILFYAIYAIALGRIFKKAGEKSWPAWVPIYNTWKLYEIGGQKGWWAILALIPVVNIVAYVFMIIAMYEVGGKLNKSGVFVLWAIFFPLIWVLWLAFDKSTWGDTPAIIADTTPAPVSDVTPEATTAPAEPSAPAVEETPAVEAPAPEAEPTPAPEAPTSEAPSTETPSEEAPAPEGDQNNTPPAM